MRAFLSDRRAALDAALIALIGAAGVLSYLQIQPLSGLVVLLAMCVVPGAAFLTCAGASDPLTSAALAVGLSLAIDTAVATALAWSGWWHPEWAALAVATVTAGLLLTDIRRTRTDRSQACAVS